MPPHCDSMDGPVVVAARRALEAGDVELVLPFVHEVGEAEVREAFERAAKARALGGEAREVADLYVFDTVVRVHRAGEGAPFTGVKPAGLDVGPVIPVAEAAIEAGTVADRTASSALEVKRRSTGVAAAAATRPKLSAGRDRSAEHAVRAP